MNTYTQGRTSTEIDFSAADAHTFWSGKKRGYKTRADYMIRCKCKTGRYVRFETHKQALRSASIFFDDLFGAFAGKKPSFREEIDGETMGELELLEPAVVVCVLVYAVYGDVSSIRNQLCHYYKLNGDSKFSR